ncbi:MAG: DUF1501 domain-containing protein, partial [Pirellulaceae bacterium]
MRPHVEHLQQLTRRHFLRDCQLGLGAMALAGLGTRSASAAPGGFVNPLAARNPHFAPTAKRVIYLHLAGSPPHLDLLDYKPELVRRNDEKCPDEFYNGKRFAFTSAHPTLLGTPQKFRQHGESGAWMSEAIPHLAGVADDLTIVKSMYTEQFNHAPAQLLLYTGSPRSGRP